MQKDLVGYFEWLPKIGERGNSVYARGLQVMEGKGRMGRPKHSGEKGE